MLRIAICDDQPRELDIITEYIKEFLNAHSEEAKIQEFSHPDHLLTAIETESFHIYILDIVMPMVSGLELGRASAVSAERHRLSTSPPSRAMRWTPMRSIRCIT